MKRSQTERLWLVGGSLTGFVMLLVGYFFFIGPQRAQTDDVVSRTAAARAEVASMRLRIAAMHDQNKQFARYRADLAAAQRALPSTSGLSDFLRSLQTLGNATQTHIQMLTVGPPTDVSAVASGSPAGAPGPATPTATPSTTAPNPAGAAALRASTGVYGLTITAGVAGSVSALNSFLDQLQSVQPRAVLITQITEGDATTAGTGSRTSTTLQLTMQAFVAPTSAGEGSQLAAASHK